MEKNASFKSNTGDYIGAFAATEWQDDLYVMFTRLDKEKDQQYDANTSAMYSAETFYWSRETKEGDAAGRIPVGDGQEYHVLMLNYSDKDDQSLIVEYGAASRTLVAFGALISTLAVAYMF